MLSIRSATIADVPLILDFVRKLAEYERAPNAVRATEDDFRRDGFGPSPKFHCLIADWEQKPVGFALFFYAYSTWHGRPGLYLEDLFVLPESRGKGIGKALLERLAQIAIRENCFALAWMVLEWNELAIKFYESLGASTMSEWETMRLMEPHLSRLAEGASPKAPSETGAITK